MRLIILTSIIVLCLTSCKQPANPQPKVKPVQEELVEEVRHDEFVYFSWLESLNVREAPNLGAKVVGKVNPKDELRKTGNTSTNEIVVVLRGIAYKDYWYEVETLALGTVWVFGGAIKRNDEQKGNSAITDLRFSFPSFGEYNLRKWTLEDEVTSSGGDAQVMTKTYVHPNGGRKMTITKTDMGAHGYSITHELSGTNDKLVLSRKVHFDNDTKSLTEEVITHNIYPKRKAWRTQDIGVSHMALNDKPLIALGEWTFEDVD